MRFPQWRCCVHFNGSGPAAQGRQHGTIGLVFDIYTPYVAAVAAFHLLVAAAATYKVSRKWIWVIGGIEYCVFWMLCCVVLAMLTWPK
jgi:hypothetical protein